MTVFEQLTNEPLHERAYAALREAIKAGKFQPGQAVTVRGIAHDLGISATPAREALQRLIAEQALQLLPNRNVVVPVLKRDRFEEITKVRLRLEGLAAAEAAHKITKRETDALATHEKAMNAAIAKKQFNAYLLHNEQFHFTIYKAAQMPFMLQVIEAAWMQIGPWLNMLASEGRFRENGQRLPRRDHQRHDLQGRRGRGARGPARYLRSSRLSATPSALQHIRPSTAQKPPLAFSAWQASAQALRCYML